MAKKTKPGESDPPEAPAREPRAGVPNAVFARLMEEHTPAVLKEAAGLWLHGPDAEDFAQSVFEDLHGKYWTLDPKVEMKVHVLASCAATRVPFRKDQRRSRKTNVGISRDLAGATEEDLVEGVVGHEMVETINGTLADMSRAMRETLLRNVIGGETVKEIHEKTGAPMGTVGTHLTAAKKKLREALGLDGDGAPRDDADLPEAVAVAIKSLSGRAVRTPAQDTRLKKRLAFLAVKPFSPKPWMSAKVRTGLIAGGVGAVVVAIAAAVAMSMRREPAPEDASPGPGSTAVGDRDFDHGRRGARSPARGTARAVVPNAVASSAEPRPNAEPPH
jgi:DNA-directed RNA polymerase specialized sigma24 family protein